MFCSKCGSKIEEKTKFCSNCGNRISSNSEIDQEIKEKNTDKKTKFILENRNKTKYIICSIVILAAICIIGFMISKGMLDKNSTNSTAISNAVTSEENQNAKKDMENSQKQAKINVTQVNTDNFPLIKIYFSVIDDQNNKLNNLDIKYFKIGEKFGENSYDSNNIISDLKLLNENEAINLNLVMDVSSSMNGEKIKQAQNSANNFLDIVNYNSGDKIEIISFNDSIGINQSFSNDKQSLKNCISNLKTNGGTAFYDSVYTALVETNKQFGHKCVIAFTDGEDNKSHYSENDIVSLSKQLSIPVYIIGIGSDIKSQPLEKLALQTGGYYKSVSDINNIETIYKDIFKNQKAQYVLTYTTNNSKVSNDWRTISISLNNDQYIGNIETQFIPKQSISVDTSKIAINNSYQNDNIKLDNNLKEDLMTSINKYNSYWFAAMSNKNANLIVNSTQVEKDRTNGLIQDMKDSGKSYVGYMTKTIFDLDSVKLELQNGKHVAYIDDSEEFKDIYYTGTSPEPQPNHKLWRYKLIYDSNSKIWLVDSHTALSDFNPVNKREF